MTKFIGRFFLYLVFAATTGCASLPTEPVPNPPLAVSRAPVSVDDRPVVAYVLGSGAARGFAHVGVLKTLEEHGISPDIIVGTSAGSLVGALYAGGIRGEELVQAALELERSDVADWSLPNRGVIRGTLLQRLVNERLKNRAIETLDIVFACVATALRTGERTVFTQGNTGMAVRASSSFPGVFRPVTINGQEYVDGGVVSPVPVRVARELGAEFVIAVDVSKLPEKDANIDSTFQVLHQSFLIMSQAMVDAELKDADIVIRPDVSEISLLAFDKREHAMREGEQAAQRSIAQIKQLLQKSTRDKRMRRWNAAITGH
jgi:NTE family protein